MKKSILLHLICTLMLILVPLSNLFAQRDIRTTLMCDVVKVENGSYSIEEYGLLSSFDRNYEVKITATAPVALLSRDNFIRFYGAISSSIFSTYFQQEGIKVPDDLQVVLKDKPGETVDLAVTITMDEKGVNYVIASGNSISKMDLQWRNQLYSDVQ